MVRLPQMAQWRVRSAAAVLAENLIRRRRGEPARVVLLGYGLRTADRKTDERFRPGQLPQTRTWSAHQRMRAIRQHYQSGDGCSIPPSTTGWPDTYPRSREKQDRRKRVHSAWLDPVDRSCAGCAQSTAQVATERGGYRGAFQRGDILTELLIAGTLTSVSHPWYCSRGPFY